MRAGAKVEETGVNHRMRVESRGAFSGGNPSPSSLGRLRRCADKGILVVDHQPQGSLQALADRLADGLQDLGAGIPFAVRFDDRPRCVRRGGAVQHLLNGVAVLIQSSPDFASPRR